MPGLGRRIIARQLPQNGTPIYAPGRAGMNTECSLSANNDDFCKSLQKINLAGIRGASAGPATASCCTL
jgi:hypothetical protein